MRLERTSGSRSGRTAARFLRKPEGPNVRGLCTLPLASRLRFLVALPADFVTLPAHQLPPG